jgi:hypothetical protein
VRSRSAHLNLSEVAYENENQVTLSDLRPVESEDDLLLLVSSEKLPFVT